MKSSFGTCPMTRQQLIDEYFIENRTKILDLAAFLDRFDRSKDQSQEPDFRMHALREALQALCSTTGSRVNQIQMIFSDPTVEPLERLDQKSACGAYDRGKKEAH